MEEGTLENLMRLFFEEPPDVFSGVVESMDEKDKAYCCGYIEGYMRGVAYAQQAIKDDGIELLQK